MRVFLNTNGDFVKSPAARKWFYQMKEMIAARGYITDLNHFGTEPYDIAIIQWARPRAIRQVLEHSPNAHIGVLNPGYLGVPKQFIPKNKRYKRNSRLMWIVNNVDFFIVTGFMWRELLLPYHRRVYLTIDYENSDVKLVKKHTKTNNLIIGYHGNSLHYKHQFFPHGAKALQRLAREFDFTLKIITSNVNSQPRIKGIHTEFIEFDVKTFDDQIATFDIGICPVFSDMIDLTNPLIYIRNPNRVNTLLFYGIPSVTSPIPQACHDLCDGETALFAVTEEGWYQALRKLIVNPDLRNRIGNAGRKMVEKRFSEKAATDLFLKMLDDELKQPVCQK